VHALTPTETPGTSAVIRLYDKRPPESCHLSRSPHCGQTLTARNRTQTAGRSSLRGLTEVDSDGSRKPSAQSSGAPRRRKTSIWHLAFGRARSALGRWGIRTMARSSSTRSSSL
jgi:hypothetical protein